MAVRNVAPNIFADGAPIEVLPDELSRLTAARLDSSRGLTLLNYSTRWQKAADCLVNDDFLGASLKEFACEFDVRFSFDAAITELMYEIFPSDEVCALVRAIVRQSVTDDLVCAVSEAYLRFMTWTCMLGGVPLGYVRGASLAGGHGGEEAEGPGAICDRRTVLAEYARADSTFRSFDRAVDSTEKFIAALGTIGNVSNWTLREMSLKVAAVERRLLAEGPEGVEKFTHVAATALEIVKRLRDGYALAVPRADARALIVFEHATGRCWVLDRRGVRFGCRWLADPPVEDLSRWDPSGDSPPPVDFVSVVAEGHVESKFFRGLRDEFFNAVLVNAKRSLVVAPGGSGAGDEKLNEKLRDYFVGLTEKFPHQFYGDLLKTTKNRDTETRIGLAYSALGAGASATSSSGPSSVVDIPGINPAANGVGATTFGTGAIVDNFEELTRRRILSELQGMIDSYRTSNDRYLDMKRFLDGFSEQDAGKMRRAFGELCDEDKARVDKLFAVAAENELRNGDKPCIHRLSADTKLIATYTATVGIAELEELLHLRGIAWKSKITKISMYTRRKNAIQYNNKDDRVLSDFVGNFCAAFNVGMPLLKEPVTNTLKVTDIFIFENMTKTAGVRCNIAQLVSLKPSDLSFCEERPIAPLPPLAPVTSISTTLSSSKRAPDEEEPSAHQSAPRAKRKREASSGRAPAGNPPRVR